ncbi:hypothetical protein CPB83DRAFT_894710 [Crepidotus variabilis]|uniref:Transmembrane protein n=1 Tax=Crepidotus variabilis TaxID=179855 RepID=A0A9P6EF84_9AGAR|nr:hypothetical protein CPB83DRAFT_894710 [Crepidotus variabilis]
MVDWNSPTVINATAQTSKYVGHIAFGIYLYDYIASLWFEYDFLRGKKKFKWPLVFYFANRYSMLGYLIASVTVYNFPSNYRINCRVVYGLLMSFGEVSRGLASVNFALRTIAVWSKNRFVIAGLSVAILGECAIVIIGIRSTTSTFIDGFGCVPHLEEATLYWLTVLFIYSACFDLTILVLNVSKLGLPIGRAFKLPNSLVTLIINQGIMYYFVSLTCDLIAVTVLLLDLNFVMAFMAVPADLLSTMVACRAVRSLTNRAYENQTEGQYMPSALFFAEPHSRPHTHGNTTTSPYRHNQIGIEMKTTVSPQNDSKELYREEV